MPSPAERWRNLGREFSPVDGWNDALPVVGAREFYGGDRQMGKVIRTPEPVKQDLLRRVNAGESIREAADAIGLKRQTAGHIVKRSGAPMKPPTRGLTPHEKVAEGFRLVFEQGMSAPAAAEKVGINKKTFAGHATRERKRRAALVDGPKPGAPAAPPPAAPVEETPAPAWITHEPPAFAVMPTPVESVQEALVCSSCGLPIPSAIGGSLCRACRIVAGFTEPEAPAPATAPRLCPWCDTPMAANEWGSCKPCQGNGHPPSPPPYTTPGATIACSVCHGIMEAEDVCCGDCLEDEEDDDTPAICKVRAAVRYDLGRLTVTQLYALEQFERDAIDVLMKGVA